MRQLQTAEVRAQCVTGLGLDASAFSLTSTPVLAAALRRSASFLCPCSGSSLVRSVLNPLRGLMGDVDATKVLIEEVLEQIVAHGDLLEFRDATGSASLSNTILYAAPCGFVSRSNGSVILLGVSADQLTALPDDMEKRIEHVGHVRWLRPSPDEDLRSDLLELGLIEIPYIRWIKEPSRETPGQHIARLDRHLDAAQASGEVAELMILDPEKSVRYYRGRWVDPKTRSGRFVARRPQAYGAPLWCYVQLQNGRALRLIDFPQKGSRWRGCDDAWRLQMAIDYQSQNPQRFLVRPGRPGTQRFALFSPIPMWAQRRWDAIGCRVDPTGCLLAFEFPDSEAAEEIRYARECLWLEASPDSSIPKDEARI